MFPEQLFHKHLQFRIQQLMDVLEKNNHSSVVIPSGVPQPVYWDDNNYPFKANFHFSLYVPIGPLPNSYLIIEKGERPTLVYYQPADYWHVVPDNPDPLWADAFKVVVVSNTNDWKKSLPSNLSEAIWLGEPEAAVVDLLSPDQINPAAVVAELNYYRAIKTDYEVDRLAAANLLAAKGHLSAREAFLGGATELEIHLAYMNACQHTEAELPYGNIVALGPHCAILHYTELDKSLPDQKQRLSFLIDAGAKANHYCADITRTWSTDDSFLELISDFDLLQQDIVAEIKPGLSYIDLHLLTHQRVAEFMVSHDLISVSAEQAIADNITATFLPHGLGHLLGLQVHDIGGHQQNILGELRPPPENHPYLRLTRELEPGFCVTVEPGIYFIDMLMAELKQSPAGKGVNWALINQLKHFGGIRIEDDVIVTDFGYQNLSRQAFQQLAS